MADMMMFPDTVEEFMEQYKMVDKEQIYSNGIEYVPIFRMKQWFEHVSDTDTISRQAAIDAVSEECQEFRGIFERCKEKLLALSSEQPETPCYLDSPCEYQNKDIKLPSAQLATDINVGDTFSRKGVFIPDITVEMLWQASLEGVEDLMASGKMEDISLPFAQPERKKGEWEEIEVIPEAYDIAGVKTWASMMRCNQCGFTTFAIEGHFAQYDFCPSCGADMRTEGNDDN